MSIPTTQNEEVANRGNEGITDGGVGGSTTSLPHEAGRRGMGVGLSVFLWLVAGVVMQGVALLIAVGTSFEVGSHRVAFKWLFPVSMFWIDKNGQLGPAASLFLLVQFAIYGGIMATGSAMGYTRWFLFGLFALHLVLAVFCVMVNPALLP